MGKRVLPSLLTMRTEVCSCDLCCLWARGRAAVLTGAQACSIEYRRLATPLTPSSSALTSLAPLEPPRAEALLHWLLRFTAGAWVRHPWPRSLPSPLSGRCPQSRSADGRRKHAQGLQRSPEAVVQLLPLGDCIPPRIGELATLWSGGSPPRPEHDSEGISRTWRARGRSWGL